MENKKLTFTIWLLIISAWGNAAVGDLFVDKPSGLSALVLEGHELHPLLKTREISIKAPIKHVSPDLVPENPYLSSDIEFVQAIARSGSHGRLGGEGIKAALYALYVLENELGFYGLEVISKADANRKEKELREIWKHNISLNRAQIHRKGLVLVAVWSDGVMTEVWDAVNAKVIQQLKFGSFRF